MRQYCSCVTLTFARALGLFDQRRARAGNVHNFVVLISGYPVTRPAHQIANYMPLGKPDKLARIPTDYKGSNQPAGAAKMRKVDPTLVSIQ